MFIQTAHQTEKHGIAEDLMKILISDHKKNNEVHRQKGSYKPYTL